MSFTSILKKEGSHLVRAGATAAAFWAVNETLIEAKGNGVMRAAVSAGSDFAASQALDMWLPYAIKDQTSAFASTTYLHPIASGIAYALADLVVKQDPRSLLTKAIHQAGASALGGYLESPVAKALGV